MKKAQIGFFFFRLIFTDKIWTLIILALSLENAVGWVFSVYFRMAAASQKKVNFLNPFFIFFLSNMPGRRQGFFSPSCFLLLVINLLFGVLYY